jgi:CheY-like chemotaxis protein
LVINAKEAFIGKEKPYEIKIQTDIKIFENLTMNYEKTLNGKYVEIKIKDNGIGIPEDVLPRIFDPFFTTKPNGSGLGLSTISKIVNKAGGYMYVESKVNEGTTFTILLPYMELENEINLTTNLKKNCLKGNETILIVEDDQALRNITCRVFRKFGYHMFEASTALEAISILKRIKIDMIILDVVLPDKSGTELLELIKSENNNIKFIFISGYPKEILHEKFSMNLEDNFLCKPFTPNLLLKKVKEILDS